ncbi:metallophosphoesterase [Aurantibacter crassamenti]|uniref:metallophosphoesterase n=1 Tax=Aurantibacter crassamenti TaxID=1837375 RepID=UPI001939559D|nr:metallophosphoesterase [Aurantibacter crassamenti]MBM1107668.1 metallophosphoesterase [Aurantibacter crassamenti]
MIFFKRITWAFLTFSLVIAFSCNSKNDPPKDSDDPTDPIDSVITTPEPTPLDSIIFTAIGDVPYNEGQRTDLIAMINTHNTKSKSEFVVHVGDIKPGADPCTEPVYKDVSEILSEFSIPTFMLLGDNEYNDCDDPISALELWNKYFLDFHKNWTFEPTVTYQENRTENFVWSQKQVMFMGLNLVGSSAHDQEEWDTRLEDNGRFLQDYVTANADDLKALVIFGHANMVELGPDKFEPFTDILKSVATEFEKPILYVQGDGHFWLLNRPYDEMNILRVQVEGGATAVQITVHPDNEKPFSFDRKFLE